jgi:hypothetical protein
MMKASKGMSFVPLQFDTPIPAAAACGESVKVACLDCSGCFADCGQVASKVPIVPVRLNVHPVCDHMEDCLIGSFVDRAAWWLYIAVHSRFAFVGRCYGLFDKPSNTARQAVLYQKVC